MQHGGAAWTVPDRPFGAAPQGAAPADSSSPSYRGLSFSPQRQPRLLLVQAPAAAGTADNGLGDAQVVTTDRQPGGSSGRSDGYKIVKGTVAGDTLTTPGITLSASATPPTAMQHFVASWGYSAQVMTTQVSRNGTDITSPNKPEVPVMVGELNQMGVTFSPVPPDVAPPTYQWTIPGDKIKNFVETAGDPNATPPTFSTGKKVELPAADLQTQSPRFYWYNGTFAGDSKDVQVTVTVDGETYTLKGKCKVHRPTMNHFTGTFTDRVPTVGVTDYLIGGEHRTRLGLGDFLHDGITWDAEVSTPDHGAGEIGFTQLLTEQTSYTRNDNSITTLSSGGKYALDGGLGAMYAGTVAIGNSDTKTRRISDTPENPLTDSYKHTSVDNSFKTYLMYKPKNPGPDNLSVWVPLGVLNWDWSGTATKITATNPKTGLPETRWEGSGTPSNGPGGTAPAPKIGATTTTFPEWEKAHSDLNFVG